MYECGNCGAIFSEPEIEYEDIGFNTELGHYPVYEPYSVCPCCGSDCFCEYEEEKEEDDD